MKKNKRKKMLGGAEVKLVRVNAMADRGGGREAVEGGGAGSSGGVERESNGVGGFSSSAMEVTTFNHRFSSETEFPVWEKIGAVVRLSYGIGELKFPF